MSTNVNYKVTAIVSIYKAERFMRACLEDLVEQTIFEQTEVIIIDACSPENEQAIVMEFAEKYSNIIYVRTPVRETLYASWNRAIRMARGEYITNANADDRHAPHAFERLAAELDAHAAVALVYADCRVTNEINAHFDTAPIMRHLRWLEYDHINLLRRCEVGPQPMWRRSVHEKVGFFNDSYTVVGDYDMWLRISEHYAFRYIPEELGLYLQYDNNLENQNPQRSYDESTKVKKEALQRFMQPSFKMHTPFELQVRVYSAKLMQELEELKKGKSVDDYNAFEFKFYAYAILAARLGDRKNALEIMALFFSLAQNSSNMCHLYRFLLLTSEGEAPGVLRHELACIDEKPLVSVVVPLYNQGNFLEDAIVSVLAQTETRWEMCIVNDGSTDNSLHVAKGLLAKYNDARIKIISQANAGKAVTRNRGVKETSAPFICILDSDDMIVPTYFQTALQMLQQDTKAAWVCPKTLVFGNNNHITWAEPYDFFQSILKCPCPVTAIYRRSLWEELQGYAEDMFTREDWDFWVRAGEAGHIGLTTAQPEFIYRHAFGRWGEKPHNNTRSKKEYLKRHAWWFKTFTPQELQNMLLKYRVGMLPIEMLDINTIEMAKGVYSDKDAFKVFMTQLKASDMTS